MAVTISSPMPRGSGAIVVHRALEQAIANYAVVDYDPKLTFFPPLLRSSTRQVPATIVHTTPDYAMFFKQRGAALVSTFHNVVIDAFMRPYSTWLQDLHYRTDLRYFLKRAVAVSDRLTAVSQFTADLARRELNIDVPIDVIPNGIDTSLFAPTSTISTASKIRVLFPGNLSRRKGAHWLPDIARQLHPDVEIVCATGLRGGAGKSLQADKITDLGRVSYDKMPDLYQSVDAMILPTVREGDSLVVLEAMSAGLPVVATDCSSLPERVRHEEGGYLCGLGDTAAFAGALNRLCDPELRQRMGAYNRDRALKDFGVQTMVTRYQQLFGTLEVAE